jgi:hypothetical protein
MRFWTVMAMTAGLLLAGAGSAHAQTVYATPKPAADADCMTPSTACALSVTPAIVDAGDADTVQLAPGTYPDLGPLEYDEPVFILGVTGNRPTLKVQSFKLLGAESYLADVSIEGGGDTVLQTVSSTLDRVDATSLTGSNTNTICEFDGEDTWVTDSACHADPDSVLGANAIALQGGLHDAITLTNVTAWSPATAIAAYGGDVNIINSIAVGGTQTGAYDVAYYGGGGVSVAFSQAVRTLGDDEHMHLGDGGMKASPETIFPNVAQTLRPAAGSPTIDAGSALAGDVKPTELDLDGAPRTRGTAPDMGAYEWKPVAPRLTVADPAEVTGTSATIRANVDAGGDTTAFHVDYGTTSDYGATVDGGAAGAKTVPVDVSAPLTGLAAGTTYHYRIVATSASGTATSDDQTFTTGAPQPAAVPTPAPTASATPTPTPVKPKVTISLAANRRCVANRTQSVRVKIASGGQLKSVEVWVDKKRRLRVTKASAIKRSIKVSRLPAGSYTLEVRVTTKDGRTVKSSKKYRTCSKR